MRMITVGMGEGNVARADGSVLVALGLGSCVAVCLYDPLIRVGAMAHAMLPSVLKDRGPAFRFAESAVPVPVELIEDAGALRARLLVAVAGGAQMFGGGGAASVLDIGARNVVAAKEALVGGPV